MLRIGLRVVDGSWKTTCTVLRIVASLLRSSLRQSATFTPPTATVMVVECSSPRSTVESAVFSEPDSPTSPRLSPSRTSRKTLSSASRGASLSSKYRLNPCA